MQTDDDNFDYTVTETPINGGKIVFIETDIEVGKVSITKKYEARISGKTGRTEITKPMVKEGTFIVLIYRERFGCRIVLLEAESSEVIEVR